MDNFDGSVESLRGFQEETPVDKTQELRARLRERIEAARVKPFSAKDALLSLRRLDPEQRERFDADPESSSLIAEIEAHDREQQEAEKERFRAFVAQNAEIEKTQKEEKMADQDEMILYDTMPSGEKLYRSKKAIERAQYKI